MAILETEVEVRLNSQMITRYEALGYEIPRIKDPDGRMRVTRGTALHVKVIDLPQSSDVRLTKICDVCGGHVREQRYRDILHVRNNGVDKCISCANKRSNPQRALRRAKSGHNLAVKNPEVAALWHPSLNGVLTPSEVTPSSRKRVWWICKEDGCGHVWEAAVHCVTRGSRCPVCNMSKGERRIREYIRFLGYEFTTEEPIGGLIGEGGGALRYDVAVKYLAGTYALLIEFDGEQHGRPVDFGGKGEAHALEQFRIQREHDRRKDEYARLHNIPLLRIKHTEFDDIERKIDEALAKVMRDERVAS